MARFCCEGVGRNWAAPIASSLLFMAAACSAGRADPAGVGPAQAAPRDLTVRRGRFEDRFLLTGQLAAVHADHLVVPRIPSWQTTIRWMEDEGTVVKAGQRVVEFDTTAFAQDYGDKHLARDQARSDLDQAEAKMEGFENRSAAYFST